MRANTAIIEARLDIRTCAALLQYFRERGRTPTSRSDLIWLATEMLADGLRLVRPSVLESVDVFQQVGWDMTKGGRAGRSLSKALQEDALKADFSLPEVNSEFDSKLAEIIKDLGKEITGE